MSAPTSLKAGDLKQCATTAWARREAEVLEELTIAWRAENPGIDGEIVFQAGQRPTVRAKDKMGDLIGVIEVALGDHFVDEPGWYWRDKARGSLEAFRWYGPYATEGEARENAITPMTQNRAALPTTPEYPPSAKALFAQLREMGVGCETCKHGGPSGYIYTFCGVSWLGEDFFCPKWEPTSPPTE